MNREKSLFEQMGGTYRQVGDYLIPNIVLKSETQAEQIGKYADQMAWVQTVNRYKAIAEEIILAELIYV